MFLGTITVDALLSVVYKAASAHIFPVREIPGDPEGFGMVAVEAAAHGVPTIAFATGGIVDAVAEGDRKSVVEGKSVSVRVDLGGRRIIKKKKQLRKCLRT